MGGEVTRVGSLKEALSVLDRPHRFLLLVLGATSLFDGYDRGILSLALPQIRESFGLDQSSASLYISLLYLGALPALLITRRADRIGRRRLLIVSIAGYTVATGLTALAPTIEVFVACQFMAKLFLNAEAALVWTMAAEELPARARGLGFGWLAMNSALGIGLGAILYGGFIEPAGISWRWMYAVGLPPLLFVAYARRKLPESRRFEAARDGGRLIAKWHAILKPPHRRWLLLVVVTGFLTELTTHLQVFSIDFMQEDRDLSVTASTFMLVFAGLPGIPVMVLAGALSDRYGRRVVGCSFAVASIAGALGFFWVPGGWPVLLAFLCLTTVGQLGAWPTLGAYGSELFPTSLRSQAGAWGNVAKVGGQSASFAIAGVVLAATDSFPTTALVLVAGPLLAIVLIASMFPDTHGRELEEISAEELEESGVLDVQPAIVD